MDNAQKAIMIGVGLFITIIIIAAVMLITGMGQDMLVNGQNQVANISNSLQAQLTSDFDETTVTGAQVITAVKRYYKDESMILAVKASKSGSTVANYGKVIGTYDASSTTSVTATQKNTDIKGVGLLSDTTQTAYYVPSTASYAAHLIKVKGSDNVVGIYFERK